MGISRKVLSKEAKQFPTSFGHSKTGTHILVQTSSVQTHAMQPRLTQLQRSSPDLQASMSK